MRDILHLRSVYVGAQITMIAYAYLANSIIIYVSNSIFMMINMVQIILILIERRPIQIPESIAYFYKKIFKEMTDREFLYFWNLGHEKTSIDGPLCYAGEEMSELILIIDGTVRVIVDGVEITTLGRGAFVAEMSYITNTTASANVICNGEVTFMSWDKPQLQHLEHVNNNLSIKLQEILGRDLAVKLMRQTSKEAA